MIPNTFYEFYCLEFICFAIFQKTTIKPPNQSFPLFFLSAMLVNLFKQNKNAMIRVRLTKINNQEWNWENLILMISALQLWNASLGPAPCLQVPLPDNPLLHLPDRLLPLESRHREARDQEPHQAAGVMDQEGGAPGHHGHWRPQGRLCPRYRHGAGDKAREKNSLSPRFAAK